MGETSEMGEIRFWPLTDVGRVRGHNEDAFLVDRKLQLYIVADGMGGHAAGEVASQLAVRTIREVVARERESLLEFERGGAVKRTDVLRLLELAVQEACAAIHEEARKDESKRGMGTTVDVLLVVGRRGFVAHVGDSRVYLYRNGSIHQITRDHSLIEELRRRGRLTEEQIQRIQYKNAVTRAVGVYESVEVDVFDFDVLPGDRFLLCTDGLTGYLGDGELQQLFEQVPDEQLPQHLVDLANERGGKDNITVLLVAAPSEAEEGAQRLARDVHLKFDVLHKMPLFRHLSYEELMRVLNLMELRSYGAGEPIVREGEEGEELFVVLEGRVRVHSGPRLYTHLGQGQHFGEMALVDHAVRSASVTAEDEARLLVLTRREFFRIVRDDHQVAVKMLWAFLGELARRLRDTSRELGVARDRLEREALASEVVGSGEVELPPVPLAPPAAPARPSGELPPPPPTVVDPSPPVVDEVMSTERGGSADVPSSDSLAIEVELEEDDGDGVA